MQEMDIAYNNITYLWIRETFVLAEMWSEIQFTPHIYFFCTAYVTRTYFRDNCCRLYGDSTSQHFLRSMWLLLFHSLGLFFPSLLAGKSALKGWGLKDPSLGEKYQRNLGRQLTRGISG